MSKKFIRPIFGKKHLEIRYEDGEVYVYATTEGLKKLATLCSTLSERCQGDHIHLEDYEILTDKSVKGAIILFD